MPEARLEDGGSGLTPTDDGWFVVNVRDAEWWMNESFDSTTSFENKESEFRQFGFNVSVIEPGKSNCLYHSENLQEAFLVLTGTCKLLVDGEERDLVPWDFFHCPPGTEHVFVGTGSKPAVVLMVGARSKDEQLLYPKSELAAKYGASAGETTPDPKQAYAPFARSQRGRPESWDRLPWA